MENRLRTFLWTFLWTLPFGPQGAPFLFSFFLFPGRRAPELVPSLRPEGRAPRKRPEGERGIRTGGSRSVS